MKKRSGEYETLQCFVRRDRKANELWLITFSPMLRQTVDSSYHKFRENGAVCLKLGCSMQAQGSCYQAAKVCSLLPLPR